jgi:hypothetical protein
MFVEHLMHLQDRLLPRLVLDTIHCLSIAHEELRADVNDQTHQVIRALRRLDTTDPKTVILTLRDVGGHLRELEDSLRGRDRPYSARKVRGFLDRLERVIGGAAAGTVATLQ